MIYIALNTRQVDTGSLPNFGDVSAIFSSEYVHDMVEIAPVDTGHYMGSCPTANGHNMNYNCSAWQPATLGTLEHHDHLFLANFGLLTSAYGEQTSVVGEALAFFRRSAFAGDYTALPNTSKDDSDRYFEANILGNPRLPEGVKFLVASFEALFGTSTGRDVQALATHFEWPLVWALGDAAAAQTGGGGSPGHKKKKGPFAGNQRLLDPRLMALSNVTVVPGTADSFDSMWDTVSAGRTAEPSPEQWGEWWEELLPSQTRVAPLTAGACEAASDCLGISVMTGDCVCKAQAMRLV